MTPVPIFVLMGTAGCGKTSVAVEMQKVLQCHYLEGDSLHPQHNVDKMAAGKINIYYIQTVGIESDK
jgi:gluconokinase